MIYAGSLRIGVLGGIGPEATGEYYSRVVRGLQQTGLIRQNTDFPYIIVHSIPAPELVGTISSEQLEPYKTGLRELDKTYVNAIVMVCNTIHLYLKELQEGIRAPIMDIRQKVKERMLREEVRKVAVLGTQATIRNGLYRFDGIGYIGLSTDEINGLSKAIFNYNRGKDKDVQRQFVGGIAKQCLNRGAETVLLACTEIAAMLKDVDIPKIDTFEILVESTIEFYKKAKMPLLFENESRRY